MNFKQWLILSEEEKIANANPLTDPNSIRYKKNAQQLIALGNHFKKNNNTEPSRWESELSNFLYQKRKAYQDYIKKTKKPKYKWYDTDKLFGIKAGLPIDWYLFTDKYKPERHDFKILKQKNDQNLINLGIHFKNNDNTEPHQGSPLGEFLDGKRHAFQDSENIKKDPNYEKNTRRKWYDTDPQVAEDAGLPYDWYLFTDKYKPESKKLQTNDQTLKKLGIYFKQFGEPKPRSTLGGFLYNKRKAFQDLINDTKNSKSKWYKTDLKVAEDAGLPEGWHLPNDKESISQGENLVGKTLNKLKLDAIHQYRDKGCDIMTGQCLRFDYSFIYKDQEYFVEYHGEQHYYPVYFGSTEEMTKQEIAEQALEAFEIQKKNDLKKYNYCKEKDNNFPLLVIPYWITPDRFKNRILDFIKHDNVFDTLFANSNVPPEYKVKHDKIFYKTECFATNGFGGTVDCEELNVKLTFEQFLINKNFINI